MTNRASSEWNDKMDTGRGQMTNNPQIRKGDFYE